MAVSYAQYITSPQWRDFRLRYFATHTKRCHACGSEDDIHLHHHTYERLGNERSGDVVPLCQTCHTLVHKFYEEKRRKRNRLTLTVATFTAIDLIKNAGQSAPEKPRETGKKFVPRNLRGGKKDKKGRVRSVRDWRDEVDRRPLRVDNGI